MKLSRNFDSRIRGDLLSDEHLLRFEHAFRRLLFSTLKDFERREAECLEAPLAVHSIVDHRSVTQCVLGRPGRGESA